MKVTGEQDTILRPPQLPPPVPSLTPLVLKSIQILPSGHPIGLSQMTYLHVMFACCMHSSLRS